MPSAKPPRKLTFPCTMVKIHPRMQYFAFHVPEEITQKLGTKRAVAVSVRLNDTVSYFVSLAPIGGGRHLLRCNAKAIAAARLKEGDRVKVEITVLDRSEIPKDLLSALRAEGLEAAYRATSVGQQNFLIKTIEAASKPETRAKRIVEAVEAARHKRGRMAAKKAKA